MNHEVVSRLIRQLHGTLEGRSAITQEDRAQLEQLAADLQAVLARPGAAAGSGHQGIIDRLRNAVSRFEVSHPDLTATMAQVSQKLSDMGI
jgi:hypothetical protein